MTLLSGMPSMEWFILMLVTVVLLAIPAFAIVFIVRKQQLKRQIRTLKDEKIQLLESLLVTGKQ